MIVSFKNQATEDIFDSKNSKAASKICPPNLWSVARRKLDQLNAITSLDELLIPPGNHLETLKGDRKGQYSIRINQQYRICFRCQQHRVSEVEIIDYH
jgi:toxin HigB-1